MRILRTRKPYAFSFIALNPRLKIARLDSQRRNGRILGPNNLILVALFSSRVLGHVIFQLSPDPLGKHTDHMLRVELTRVYSRCS